MPDRSSSGLLDGDAGTQLTECLEVLTAAAGVRQRSLVTQGGPKLRRLVEPGRDHVLEVRRHDADHFELLIVHAQHATDHGRICIEPATPEPIAQHENAIPIGMIVVFAEGATERRTRAQHVEEIPAHAHAG